MAGAQDRAEHREAHGWWRRLVSPEIWVCEGGDPGHAGHWPEKGGTRSLGVRVGTETAGRTWSSVVPVLGTDSQSRQAGFVQKGKADVRSQQRLKQAAQVPRTKRRFRVGSH